MTDLAGSPGPSGIEAELRDLGHHLDTGPAPDVATAVRARLAAAPPPRAWYRTAPWKRTGPPVTTRRGWRYAAALLVVVLVVAGTPQGRAAASRVLRLAGVEFRDGSGPPPGPGRLPDERRTTLEGARRLTGFTPQVPAALGRPDEVVVSDGGRIATLLYTRTTGRIRIDEYDGALHDVLFEKFAAGGTVVRTTVTGIRAYWVTTPHTLVYVDRDGHEREDTTRLAGPTLVWQSGNLAVRLEGPTSLPQARALATTLH